ncbi:MAG: tetratricopeptide repeat protein [Planctomycetes bacterium]|nr:tetratricopeptide repeat protein [Planctomycetota bacterium]
MAVYANSFSGAFVFDDTFHILNNPRIVNPGMLGTILTTTRRPVIELSLALNYAISGFEANSYHAFNVLVHILAALTLYGVVRRTLLLEDLRDRYGQRAPWLALAAALIWAVHPLQTQSVTYIIQRGESLMGLFYLLTLYCVIRGAGSPRCRRWYVAAVITCTLGMGSKAVMVTAPVVILLYDRVFLAKSFGAALRQRWGLYTALAATWLVLVQVGVVGGVLSTSHPTARVGFSFKGISPLEYAMTQLGVLVYYLRLSFWPNPLCLDYDWPVVRSVGQLGPEVILIVGAAVATAWALWRRPALGFVGVWFFAILAPTSSFIPIHDPILEHRMYLSLAAVVVLTVLAGDGLLQNLSEKKGLRGPRRRMITVVLVGALVIALGATTHRRNQAYRSEVVMWSDVVEQWPDNGRARYNLANALLKAERLDEAIRQSHEAIRIRPDHAPSHYDLGVILEGLGKPDEAVTEYLKVLQLDPDHANAHLNLGVLHYRRGETELAINEYRETLRISPAHFIAYNNLGNALAKLGRTDEALDAFRQVARINPYHVQAHIKIGRILVRQNRLDEGIKAFQQALRADPGNETARRELEAALARQGTMLEP